MDMAIVQPYGSWQSPLSAETVVSQAITLTVPHIEGDAVYWMEGRPAEKGRIAVVRRKNGKNADVFSHEFSARTRANEYGGSCYTIHNNVVYFCNEKDQRIYQATIASAPMPITPDANMRYADLVYDDRRSILYCIREDYSPQKEPITTIVKIDPQEESAGEVVASGHDFYSNARLSPGSTRLAYLCWDHPNLPWDGCKLMLHEIKRDGSLQEGICVAGGPDESIFQPSFGPDGTLYFVSDRSGYWNLYRYSNGKVEALYPMEAEFGAPMWVYGLSMYAFVPNNGSYDIVCAYTVRGIDYLGHLSLKNFTMKQLDVPYTSIKYVQADDKGVYFIGSSPTEPATLVRMDLAHNKCEVLQRSRTLNLEEGMISLPQEIEFTTEDGKKAYGFFYPPMNPHFIGPESERPPLIVRCHGGPSGCSTTAINMETQYWTTRGIAVFDVNYGGSTGFGRDYRERLRENWGVVDVNDACGGALHLAQMGLVDRDRLAIKGGSAGGYTSLAAISFRDVFHAAVSYFGLCDLEKMTEESAKFESRYHETLVGPYPAWKKKYIERSPIHFVKNIHCPVLLLHGTEDKVVLPAQSETIFKALKKKGIPTYYLLFEKEGHGFRQAPNMKKALEAEVLFYAKIFGFDLAEPPKRDVLEEK